MIKFLTSNMSTKKRFWSQKGPLFIFFFKNDKCVVSTSQELWKDISHVTIRHFLQILIKKIHFVGQKGAFTCFLHLYNTDNHYLTFDVHYLLKYSLKFVYALLKYSLKFVYASYQVYFLRCRVQFNENNYSILMFL